METNDRIKIKYQLTCQSYNSNIHLNVTERTEIMKPMGLKESLDNWYLDKCKKKIYAD